MKGAERAQFRRCPTGVWPGAAETAFSHLQREDIQGFRSDAGPL